MLSTIFRISSALAVTIYSSALLATPTVSGNVISWTDDGWHQVQLQSTYETVCNGGRQCTVPDGVYKVINHSTGEIFRFLTVPNNVPNETDSPPLPVASTGQTISYAFGDDGDYRSGVSVPGDRFHDNEDGTFVDTHTGITWLGIRNCIVNRTWGPAIEYANTLSASSDVCPDLNDQSVSGDWRLPNIKELYSLVDISDDNPSWARGIPFSGNWSDSPWELYWSSSSFQPVPENNAFAIDAAFGLIGSYSKTFPENTFYTWPIRVDR